MARRASKASGCGCLFLIIVVVGVIGSAVDGVESLFIGPGKDGGQVSHAAAPLDQQPASATPTPKPTPAPAVVSGGGGAGSGGSNQRHVYVDVNPMHPLHPHVRVHF